MKVEVVIKLSQRVQATVEARDNVKFLGTLERHLQMIAADAGSDAVRSLDAVRDALLPLMNSLRLIWVLSSHFSDDSVMGRLLQRIGAQIGVS